MQFTVEPREMDVPGGTLRWLWTHTAWGYYWQAVAALAWLVVASPVIAVVGVLAVLELAPFAWYAVLLAGVLQIVQASLFLKDNRIEMERQSTIPEWGRDLPEDASRSPTTTDMLRMVALMMGGMSSYLGVIIIATVLLSGHLGFLATFITGFGGYYFERRLSEKHGRSLLIPGINFMQWLLIRVGDGTANQRKTVGELSRTARATLLIGFTSGD